MAYENKEIMVSLGHYTAGSRKMLTWRSTPIPVKIAFAGGNTYSHIDQTVDLWRMNVS